MICHGHCSFPRFKYRRIDDTCEHFKKECKDNIIELSESLGIQIIGREK